MKTALRHFSVIVLLSWMGGNGLFAQKSKMDSLKRVLVTLKDDTEKVKTYNELSKQIIKGPEIDVAFAYADSARTLSKRIKYLQGEAQSLNSIGKVYFKKGKYEDAIKCMKEGIQCYVSAGDRKGEGWMLFNLGIVYQVQGNYSEALKSNSEALKIKVELNDSIGIADAYNSTGIIYEMLGNYPEALNNQLAALKIHESLGNKKGLSVTYNNIGGIYVGQMQFEEALKYYRMCLKITLETNMDEGTINAYENIGNVQVRQKKFDEALVNEMKALEIAEKIKDRKYSAAIHLVVGGLYSEKGDYVSALREIELGRNIYEDLGIKKGMSRSYFQLGSTYYHTNKMKEARSFSERGLEISMKLGTKELIRNIYELLSKIDSTEGNFKKQFEDYHHYIIYRDSLTNEEGTKKMVQSQMQYEFDKKEAQAKADQDRKNVIAGAAKRRWEIIFWLVMGCLLLVVVFSVFLYKRFKVTQKQKLVIEHQKNLVEEKQKEIQDSIHYAKRIQKSMLPTEKYIEKSINRSKRN